MTRSGSSVPEWTVEGNPELAALAAWMLDHPWAEARHARETSRRGYLTKQATVSSGGSTRTTISLRDSRRRGGAQYRTVHGLDEIELRGERGRYRPAREVIGYDTKGDTE